MPNPRSDRDQHRFAVIVARMMKSVADNMPPHFVEISGAKTRDEFRAKLSESDSIMSIIECCAYEAQCMEEEIK
ncbi:MAG: hypothetical protein AB7L09_02855 [Nitrospira sp.]